jgi:hypothetical protein
VEVHRQEESDHKNIVGLNVVAMTETDSKAAKQLWTELVTERAHMDTECTEHAVESEAGW